MPGPRVTPVHGDETLPEKVDVVVIGGGIAGTSTALELSDMGLRVALCEKGGIGQEQSSRNWGWVRISRRDPREIPLMAEALRMWPGLTARIGRETGFRRSGIMFAGRTDKEMADYERWAEHLRPYQLDCGVLSGAEFDAVMPGCREPVKGGFFTAADGRAEPQLTAPAIAEGARDRGAAILTECAVRGIETSGGAVSAVVTERGTIACDAVVLAGGAWSRLFAGNLGINFPQLKIVSTVMRTAPLEGGPEAAYWSEHFAFRKREDGGYTLASGTANIVDIVPDSFRLAFKYLPALKHQWRDLRLRFGPRFAQEATCARNWRNDEASPFEYTRVLDPKPDEKINAKTMAALIENFPVFAKAEITQSWAGYIDVTPDAVPVISAIDTLPGFFMASGFSGHGFGIGPAAGRLMAELVTGRPPCVDPHHFRFSRFFDGTRLEPDDGF
ncbi:NAD(P)/FAD-dependent oxidoreductase [Pseudodonghicola flavimaris]|uniref:FAD-binding oxidoreductase n=1 Tax=Pseudodonghicola flavimaris TaxID=3050036 RepID=A0ABT7F3V0_9RHOB|nr:FAD-binding oxidoreductase [Pseudodonghicola flavimaris]MDK3019109.1 FAD-binding oxidoreductase [Pseudodonghicola flavimaris]